MTLIHEVKQESATAAAHTTKQKKENVAIPKKRKKMASDISSGFSRPAPVPPVSPKILTARKRTKNGVLKAPTELWLV